MRAEPDEFLRRAGDEARRYGGDPWVFLRELIQNARDAGASAVEIATGSAAGREWVEVRDDGEGMDDGQARRFLFTLYASSKEDGTQAAGRFGVGFWSVLRFSPQRIEVRSVPRTGPGWRVTLDGQLAVLEQARFEGRPGTAVRLVRPGTGADLSGAVLRAVRESARFVTRRGSRHAPLRVAVDGRVVAEPFVLAPPSLSFRRRDVRGVVGLAPTPRIELHAFGLKVREAGTFEELLGEGSGRGAAAGVEDRRGLAPRALLDSDRLEVLLARGDVRDDRTLRRLVAVARGELDRLLRAELDRHAPRGPVGRLRDRVAAALGGRRLRRIALPLLVVAAAGLVGAALLPRLLPPAGDGAAAAAPPAPTAASYRDPAATYRGPDVGLGEGERRAAAIRYRPPGPGLLLAVARFDGADLDEPGRTQPPRPAAPRTAAVAAFEVEVTLDAGPGAVRLPVPTGMAADPASATLDGAPVALWTTVREETALVLGERVSGTVRYRVAPGLDGSPAAAPRWPPLPPALAAEAARISRLEPGARPAAAVAAVRARVAYDRSPETAARHRAARGRGGGVVERALLVGAGDCDVQNSVLASVLSAAGLPARLAVGYVGQGGAVLPGLHAWAEYLTPEGRWRAADATVADPSAAPGDAPPPSPAAVGGRPTQPVAGPPAWLAALALGLVGLAATAAAMVRRRTARSVDLGDGLDLAAVVRGVIERPSAFAGLAAVERRPLVPCRCGRRLSVNAARDLARRGRLLRASRASLLADRAVAAGAAVVDAGTPEGAAAADGLGAIDLDRWDRRLGAQRPAALTALEGALRRCGAEISLVAAGAGEAPSTLELDGLGLGRGVLVAVDPATPAARPADAGSAAAALALLAWVEDEIGAPAVAQGDLARVAREALRCGGGG